MKKYILVGLFLINFALVFQNGKLSINAGVNTYSQSYNENMDGEFEISCGHDTYLVNSGDFGCEYCVTYLTVRTCSNGDSSYDYNDVCWTNSNCDDGNNNNNNDDNNNNSQCPGGGDPCSYCSSCYCNGSCQDPPETPKPKDCAGVEGGSAYTDKCGYCVGGSTGETACPDGCASATANRVQAETVYDRFSMQNYIMTDMFKLLAKFSVEYSITFKHYTDTDTYGFDWLGSGTRTTSVIEYTSGIPGLDYIAQMHSHPPGTMAAPSPQDFYALLIASSSNPAFNDIFVYNSGGTNYALHVENDAQAAAFLALYPKDKNIDPNTNGFIKDSALDKLYQDGRDAFIDGGYTGDANAYALAYVMATGNSGIKLLDKANSSTDFKQLDMNKKQDGTYEISKCK